MNVGLLKARYTSIIGLALMGTGCSSLNDPDERLSDAGVMSDSGVTPDAGMSDAGMMPDAGNPMTVALQVVVNGGGRIMSNPPGIDCPSTCQASFEEGSKVTLAPAADEAVGLSVWMGDCSGFEESCVVTMNEAHTVEASFAPHGSPRWVHQVSFSGQDFIESDVAVDAEGNPIVAGTVDDGGGADLYVAKLDKNTGDIIWENLIDTPVNEYYGGLATDAAGNVYASVTFNGLSEPFAIGGTQVTPDLFGNVLVVRLAAATGAFDWVRDWVGPGQDRPSAIAVDGTNLFVTGETSGGMDFDGVVLAATEGSAFLARANTEDGSVQRVRGLLGNLEIRGVAARGDHVALSGDFTAAGVFDPGCSITPVGAGADGFIIDLLTENLTCQWTRTFGDRTDNVIVFGRGVAAHPEGGWIMTGAFQGNVLFAMSGSALTSRGAYDAFVVRYDAQGTHVWSFRYGDANNDLGLEVKVTPEGQTILTGQFESSITFGTHSLTGASDVFVTRMSAGNTPTHDWAIALGGDDTDRPEGLATDVDGHVYVSAYFKGMTDIDGQGLTALDYDGWVAALVR